MSVRTMAKSSDSKGRGGKGCAKEDDVDRGHGGEIDGGKGKGSDNSVTVKMVAWAMCQDDSEEPYSPYRPSSAGGQSDPQRGGLKLRRSRRLLFGSRQADASVADQNTTAGPTSKHHHRVQPGPARRGLFCL